MSPLRKLLKHPATYLAILGLLAGSVFADSFRPPERQLAARVYIVVVRGLPACGQPCFGLAMFSAATVPPALATR